MNNMGMEMLEYISPCWNWTTGEPKVDYTTVKIYHFGRVGFRGVQWARIQEASTFFSIYEIISVNVFKQICS